MIKDTVTQTFATALAQNFATAQNAENKQLAKDYAAQAVYYNSQAPTEAQKNAFVAASIDAAMVFASNSDLMKIKQLTYVPDGMVVPPGSNPSGPIAAITAAVGQSLNSVAKAVTTPVGTEYIALYRRSLSAVARVPGNAALVDFMSWLSRVMACDLPADLLDTSTNGLNQFRLDYSESITSAVLASKSSLVRGWADYYTKQKDYYDATINNPGKAAKATADFKAAVAAFEKIVAGNPELSEVKYQLYPSDSIIQSLRGSLPPMPLYNIISLARPTELQYNTATDDFDGLAWIKAFKDSFYALNTKTYILTFADAYQMRGDIGFCLFPRPIRNENAK